MTNDLGKASNNSNLTGRRLGLFAMVAASFGLIVFAVIDVIQGVPDVYPNQQWINVTQGTYLTCFFSWLLFYDFYQKSSGRKSFYGAMYKIFFVFLLVSLGFNLYFLFLT